MKSHLPCATSELHLTRPQTAIMASLSNMEGDLDPRVAKVKAQYERTLLQVRQLSGVRPHRPTVGDNDARAFARAARR